MAGATEIALPGEVRLRTSLEHAVVAVPLVLPP